MKITAFVSLLSIFNASAFTMSPSSSQQRTPTSVNMAASESSRRSVLSTASKALSTAALLTIANPAPSQARLEPVNKPDLLPSDPDQVVIQTQKFLTTGQAKRMSDLIRSLEKETGFRLRVLCQSYPNTPGLAIRDYWSLGKEGQKDDKYIVLVVDEFGGKGNVLNFNVGEGVKFALPNVFWTRLSGKYGTTFFVRDNGIDIAITNAIEAITQCLRSEDGFCTSVPDQGISMKSLGL
mmetsp:Transcript_21790/g.32306  ORF Transcript_21790/g.32306 Transcript_21790/m.32306 type:complete len:237 (+) Transcript_21790:89-799(+)